MTPVELDKILDLPNLFVEYGVKESDVLIHLFPRDGLEDQWADGHYINRCHKCHAEVPMGDRPGSTKPCLKCGNMGLVYIPGRVEEKSKVSFPGNMLDFIKESVDHVWIGEVAAEEIPELGAYVIQIQRGKNTAQAAGLEHIVRRICAPIDRLLAPKN
jgi:hypothetical protein